MKGLVIKKQASGFDVKNAQNTLFVCTAQKKLKEHGIFVGDNVEFDEKTKNIVKVLPRKNKLVRPPVANLDKLVILITHTPAPDFLLLDKMLLFCEVNNIKPIICHSKSDLDTSNLKYLQNTYGKFYDVVELSSITRVGVEKLITLVKKSICAVAGQSGVGKSALLNAITGKNVATEGELSTKILRGKQTTRHSELFEISKNTYLADTAGFSSLDEAYLPILPEDLAKYYPDFVALLPNCKFSTCTHLHEPNCAVKDAVDNKKIDSGRYARYQLIYEALKNKENY